ncbi:UDP-phosphate alpha-N-acetyl-D-fucosaminephosphotransferase [Leucobacter exalbidus]|nr:UDP-phosphate alpha-N-acetyl-D-fucosaminephosphotransferase [Leucobacter exalbidus]
MTIALLAGGVSLACSLLLPLVVRPLLVRLGIMDVPNERSSHARPVLRGLGLAVLIAMVIAGITAVLLLRSEASASQAWPTLLVVVIGSLCAGLLGLTEDLRGLSVPVRSVLLLVIALLVPVLLIASNGEPVLNFVGTGGTAALSIGGTIVLVVYAVLFISSYINVANFMDGLNGISGFHGVIAGLTFAAAGWLTGHAWLIAAGLILAAGFAGFLPWNLTKPGAFLGDVGSYLLGGATAITSFAALLAGVPLLASIGPMVIYFGDVGVTLVKRMRAGHKWDEPHKEHTYQRIQQMGYTHVQASACTAGATLLASLLGLASCFVGLLGTLTLLVAGLVVLGVYLALPKLLPLRAA